MNTPAERLCIASSDSDLRSCPEFDCAGCGRHILQFCGEMTEPPRCGACRVMPGWLEQPAIRAALDPGGHAFPPGLSTVPAWPGGAA